MFFKTLLSTLVIAASTFVAPAAEAFTAGEQRLLNEVAEAGVTVEVTECPQDLGAYGLFLPKFNTIVICTNVATTKEMQWQTFRHEAVHAAQFCIDPSMQTTVYSPNWVIENTSKQDAWVITNNYEREDWLIEGEAFTMMRWSNNQIARIVDNACNVVIQ